METTDSLDLRSTAEFSDKAEGRRPQSPPELHNIVCAVRDTAATAYAVKVCELDNKNFYVSHKNGIDGSQFDFLNFGEKWRDDQKAVDYTLIRVWNNIDERA